MSIPRFELPEPEGGDISIAYRMLAPCWTMYAVSAIVIVLRVIAKYRIRLGLMLDDVLLMLSLPFGIAMLGLATAGIHSGLGRHFFYLTPSERSNSMMFVFIGEPFGILCPMFGRLSFMVYLRRLIVASRPKRYFIYALATQHIVINIVVLVLSLTQCAKITTLWDPLDTPSKCWSGLLQAAFGYFLGATNGATDLVLTLMPILVVWNLQLSRNLKIGLSALLGLSCFAMVASIYRTYTLSHLFDRLDFTWNTVQFIIWCTVENATVIIASSIPTLRPLFFPAKSKTSSYEMHSDYAKGRASASRPRSHVVAGSHAGVESGSSRENILVPKNGIWKNTEFEVCYDVDVERADGKEKKKKGGSG